GTLYRYETTVDGSAVHRIRVGFFPDRSAALAAAQNLATAASLGTTPWAVQPNVTEARRFGAQAISDLWVVNLSSTPDEAESLALWQILEGQSAALEKLQDSRAKGLSALSLYRYDTSVGGRKQYRIRLGFFESAQAAQEAGRLLAEAASLPESRIGRPWTVRPSAGEAASYRKD
ncbi:MAG: SPOR domain-containing protein, partial [Deltaproteobacteria bacterium]|nr:SPOR domain-containing protein [Deltaproteobacteria bacterium]